MSRAEARERDAVAWFERELDALVRAVEAEVEVVRDASGVQLAPRRAAEGAQALAISIRQGQREPGAVEVSLAGWVYASSLIGAGGDDDDESAEDALERAATTLDLIGAALFGELRVRELLVAGRARRWTAELKSRRGAGWRALGGQGPGSWNPLARRTNATRRNAVRRPRGYRAVDSVARPDAPWSGRAGFIARLAARLEDAGELPIDGELDLHNFKPKQVKPLVLAYIDECRARGIFELRIVHGKGVGNLRRTVHALLDRHPQVLDYRLGGHGAGSWGATLVNLAPRDDAADADAP